MKMGINRNEIYGFQKFHQQQSKIDTAKDISHFDTISYYFRCKRLLILSILLLVTIILIVP